MSLPRNGFVIVAVASLWLGSADILAQVLLPESSSGGITGGAMYISKFA